MAHNIETERWGRFELRTSGPSGGNPYADVRFSAKFRYGNRTVDVSGFYDGDGHYVIRFMPDTTGEWTFETDSNMPELAGIRGSLICTEPSARNHGPVGVDRIHHFAYADGTPFHPFGTTSYVWNHQPEQLQEQTLQSLSKSAFNKIRMCVFPKHYDYNHAEPERFPFEGSLAQGFDFSRFDPSYWRKLESQIEALQGLGIEADLILFHPYDRWGFAKMSAEEDDRYLRYLMARLSSFRNVWWSLANEFDLMHAKTMQDWDRFFRVIQENDANQHLRSIHNWHHPGLHYTSNAHWYDHGKPWVTHVSIQHHDLHFVTDWRKLYRKPIVVDECRYEGDLNHGWGNITGQKMLACFWEGAARGGYVTHGETFLNPENVIWWSHGGKLRGESPARIQFLRSIMEAGPQLGETAVDFEWDAASAGVDGEYYLVYFGESRPGYRILNLPEGVTFTVDLIDTWEMKVTKLPGEYAGTCRVDLPGKAYQALRIQKVKK
ncbi:DUF5605 domain-containing protein [Cohnella candidum]|uniref:DUF5060 domain-containing protein n=1 Tax=Cohnella candidum TaxID=2674991 RepID=A0A3G3JXS8_9BACL|nr:DUF5605 domain-containing protein [Cohnella candidum]AYQ73045.1 DUF5060 domain-containing protein [Cohnella candidum]